MVPQGPHRCRGGGARPAPGRRSSVTTVGRSGGQLKTAPSETFTYDLYGAGERPQATHGLRTDTFTYDTASGRLLSASLGVLGSSPLLHAYRYNAAGDRLADSLYNNAQKARTTLTNVDGAGRIVAMQAVPGPLNTADTVHVWTYWYDALGRRVLVADSLPTLSRPVERLFYDGAMVVLRGEDYWQSGNLDANPVRLHRGQTEAYLNDLGIDRPLYSATTLLGIGCGAAGSNGTVEYFYHADERGSVRQVTFGTGTYCSTAGYGYEGFGSGSGVPSNSRPGFTGAPAEASGLVFLRNRFYDPNTGSFTQPDPVGLMGGINLYGYAGNDPVGFTDPFGLCPPKDRNVENCEHDKLGDAWRALNRYPDGRAVIREYVAAGVQVSVSATATTNHTDPQSGTVTLVGRAPGAVALGLTHEIIHVNGVRDLSNGVGVGLDEVRARNRALDLYGAFRGGDRDQARPIYGSQYEDRAANPREFDRMAYCFYAWQQDQRRCGP
jgi:RHS repeat-associated protein